MSFKLNKNNRYRLSEFEVENIICKRDTYELNDNRQYTLSQSEIETLIQMRRLKFDAASKGIDFETVKHGWIKDKKSSIFFTNPEYKDKAYKDFEKLKSNLIKWVESKSKPAAKNPRRKGDNLLLIDPADIHIGKLCSSFEVGTTYNSEIAVQRTIDGVHGILDKTKGFNIDRIAFIGGNDVLHIDTPRRTTTSGTPQDTDGMWYDNFTKACQLYQDILNELSCIAPVDFIYNPSNHDYTNGFFLAQLVEAFFSQNKNITFDCSINHRKYYKYHNNLIGTTHGDGAKANDLSMIMATESPKLWAECKHRYWYTHHVHHKNGKDLIGCTVETLRSPSESDSWHHRNGYIGVPKAIEGFLHDKNYGQIARITHNF